MVQLQVDTQSVQVDRKGEEASQDLPQSSERQSLRVVELTEDQEPHERSSTQALLEQRQAKLSAGIAQTYRRLSSPPEPVQLPIGSHWQAIVKVCGNYVVQAEQDKLVCQGNFETGEMVQPMNSAKAEEFQQIVQIWRNVSLEEPRSSFKGKGQYASSRELSPDFY